MGSTEPTYSGHAIAFHGQTFPFSSRDPRAHTVVLYSEPKRKDGMRTPELEKQLALSYQRRAPRQSIWLRNGLCQLGIAQRHLTVLFPNLSLPGDPGARFDPADVADSLFAYALAAAKRIREAVQPIKLEGLSFVDIGFELRPDGSIAKLKQSVCCSGNEAATDQIIEAVTHFGFGHFPEGESAPVDAHMHIKLERDRHGATDSQLDLHGYMPAVEARVKAAWQPRATAVKYDGRVEFLLNPDGTISSLKIWNSNEWASPEDEELALAAVRKAAPFAVLPKAFDWPVEVALDLQFMPAAETKVVAGWTP